MADTLIELFKAAGAKSPDLWKIARTDIPPKEALAELQRSYPNAFAPAIDARKLSGKDYEKYKNEMLEEGRQNTLRRIRNTNTKAALAMSRERK